MTLECSRHIVHSVATLYVRRGRAPHAHRGIDLFHEQPHSVHDSPRYFAHVWHAPVQVVLSCSRSSTPVCCCAMYDTVEAPLC